MRAEKKNHSLEKCYLMPNDCSAKSINIMGVSLYAEGIWLVRPLVGRLCDFEALEQRSPCRDRVVAALQ